MFSLRETKFKGFVLASIEVVVLLLQVKTFRCGVARIVLGQELLGAARLIVLLLQAETSRRGQDSIVPGSFRHGQDSSSISTRHGQDSST